MQFRLGPTAVSPLGRMRLYVCGITPYDTTHLGHAFTFCWVDTVARMLEHVGVEVEVCRNVTDVDDDLLAEARRRGEPWQMLASRQTFQFEDDMRHLRVRRPAFEPMSHEYITHVVFLARALLDAGAAYQRDGGVWFRGDTVVTPDGSPAPDVAVWQPSWADEPSWPSPFGPGRPGWHAECAAMATAVLGAVDVHAGGSDLRYPHHAYERAMVEAATGVAPFARAWMHVGTVHWQGAKMAKSTGNLVLVGDLLTRHRPEAIRCLLLDRPWHDDWELTDAALAAAEQRIDQLWSAVGRPGAADHAEPEAVRLLIEGQRVTDALDLAIAEGGSAARTVAKILALT